jgi:hypothetical protein
MADLIKTQLPADVAEKMAGQLQSLNDGMEPYFFNLSNDERTGIRTMAEGREGMVRAVNQVALANPDELRRKDDPLLLDGKIKYDELLEGLRQKGLSFLEKIEETQLANSKDIMVVADAFAGSLQSARMRNSALDKALKPIDEYNKKFGRPQKQGDAAGTDTTPPATES